jgi:hypothetical protein
MSRAKVLKRVCNGCDRRCEWEDMAVLEVFTPDAEFAHWTQALCRDCSSETAAFYQCSGPNVKVYWHSV